MKNLFILLIFSILAACATQSLPPQPDRSNLRPINDEAAIELIRTKTSQK